MYRVWYSTESFADYIIDHTALSRMNLHKNKMYESDANNPARFHTMPDHIRATPHKTGARRVRL